MLVCLHSRWTIQMWSEPLGLLPYRFEPTSHESDTSSESDSDSELPTVFAARTRVAPDNTAWCSCTKCAALPTERQCCCCRVLAHIRHLFSNVEGLQCITDHSEFVGACLNPLILCIALVGVIATRGGSYRPYSTAIMNKLLHVTINYFNEKGVAVNEIRGLQYG